MSPRRVRTLNNDGVRNAYESATRVIREKKTEKIIPENIKLPCTRHNGYKKNNPIRVSSYASRETRRRVNNDRARASLQIQCKRYYEKTINIVRPTSY